MRRAAPKTAERRDTLSLAEKRPATEQSDHRVEERKGRGKAPCQLQRALKRRND